MERFLTAEQIRQLDEIEADIQAAKKTLRVALNYHSNMINQIHKRKVEFWRELNQIHNLDDNKRYTVNYVRGRHEIVEFKDEDRL